MSKYYKSNYSPERELRLSRQKIAATVLPFFLKAHHLDSGNVELTYAVRDAARTADLLLAELARTEKP